MKEIKEKIIEILRITMSDSENRDWRRESHATMKELEIMRENNDRDFNDIADLIIEKVFPEYTKEIVEEEREKIIKEIKKMKIKNPICDCKTHPEHNCGITSNEAIDDIISVIKELKT